MAERIVAGLAIKASAVHDAVHRYAADAVGTDAYAITPFTTLEAYAGGQMFSFKAGTANTGSASLNVNGLGAKTIKKNVSEDLITGDILVGQVVTVIYEAVAGVMQLISKTPSIIPIRTVLSAPATRGSSTTRFDITRPGTPNVNTTRYTYDGTGTDPLISAANFPVGMRVQIRSSNFTNAGNSADGLVTASGTNYFEMTNATGGAETDKTLGSDGALIIEQTWTKPSGLRYIDVEVQGAGASGGSTRKGGDSVFKTVIAGGGVSTGPTSSGGDYSVIGRPSPDVTENTSVDGKAGGNSVLGTGGVGNGGTGTQGGGGGGWGPSNSSGDGGQGGYSGSYARKIFAASALSSTEVYFVGKGGLGTDGGADEDSGGPGGDGLIIITEYY